MMFVTTKLIYLFLVVRTVVIIPSIGVPSQISHIELFEETLILLL